MYPGRAQECITYHSKWLPVLRSLERMNCSVPPQLTHTWKEQADETVSLIELMKRYPNGPMDLLDEMAKARQAEADRLEAESRRSRR
jgi:hypothetical protein